MVENTPETREFYCFDSDLVPDDLSFGSSMLWSELILCGRVGPRLRGCIGDGIAKSGRFDGRPDAHSLLGEY